MAAKKEDPETGITPSATDGDPGQDWADNDIERRKQLKAAREAEEEAAVTGKKGRPIDDQPEPDDADEPELFPLGTIEGDPKVTHRNLIKAGTTVKLECALSRAAVPLVGGLHAFGAAGEVLVTFEAGKVNQVPEFHADRQADGSRKVKAVKLVQELTAVHVRDASGMLTLDQVLDILEQEFGIPRSADKIAKVFGPQTPEQRASAAAG